MIYEGVRISGAPGADLSPHTAQFNKLVEKHGGKAIANFIVTVGQGTNDFVHIFAFKDWAAYGAAGDGLNADPEWLQLLAESGTKVGAISNALMTPLPESGLK